MNGFARFIASRLGGFVIVDEPQGNGLKGDVAGHEFHGNQWTGGGGGGSTSSAGRYAVVSHGGNHYVLDHETGDVFRASSHAQATEVVANAHSESSRMQSDPDYEPHALDPIASNDVSDAEAEAVNVAAGRY